MCKSTLCECGGYKHPRVQIHTRSCPSLNHYSFTYNTFSRGDLYYMINAGLHVINLYLLPDDAALRHPALAIDDLVKAGPRMIDPLLRAAGLFHPSTHRKFPQVFMQLLTAVRSNEDLVTELDSLADASDPDKSNDWHFDRVSAVLTLRGLAEYSRLLSAARSFARGRYPDLHSARFNKEDHGR